MFCLICFESSVTELNRIIKESRPHFDGLTLDQTRDFLIVYLIFGVLYVLIDGKQTYKIPSPNIDFIAGGLEQFSSKVRNGMPRTNLEVVLNATEE